MSAGRSPKRLSKVAREFNVGISTIVDFLATKGHDVDPKPNTKISDDIYRVLQDEYQSEKTAKEESRLLGLNKVDRKTISLEDTEKKEAAKKAEQDEILIKNMENVSSGLDDLVNKEKEEKAEPAEQQAEPAAEKEESEVKVVGKIDLDSMNLKTRPDKKAKAEEAKPAEAAAEPAQEKAPEAAEAPKAEAPAAEKPAEEAPKAEEKAAEETTAKAEPAAETPPAKKEDEVVKVNIKKLSGPTVVGKIDLPVVEKRKPVASSSGSTELQKKKKKRKRITKGVENKVTQKDGDKRGQGNNKRGGKPGAKKGAKPEVNEGEIQNQIRETLARLSGGGKSKGSKHRRAKREALNQQMEEERLQQEADRKILKVTEFVTANELATMMSVGVTEVISACMSLGMIVSINQRLDAETLGIVADEFGYQIEFVSTEVSEAVLEQEDNPENLLTRPPVVTIMGHVDHGKTSLLDYIRDANVIAGEAGGITQHIGAYNVNLDNGKTITFLDTPGHEAFTAMRARGAQVTDVVIIVVSADDSVMPQTKEAINHAQAAGVPMIFAINKIDKPNANPDRIREELSAMNILVEDWGGKYQSQEISAKQGTNIDELLEKVLLEAELLELQADADKKAHGTIIESQLDKGRGYVTTILVQGGTLRVGDLVLAGSHFGRVKAMHNERGAAISEAGPSIPVSMLGLNGAPNAGEKFNVLDDDKEVKNIASKRRQLQREQGVRTQKHITLDEIGRRLAIGDFQELNIIVKGDVDGSVEALSDSLLKLSTENVQVNVILKGVGQITESDVSLAVASEAIIVGFQVRPSVNARKIAEKEEIDIRLYSVIYDAIDEVKSAMEGLLAPKIEEKVVCNIEIREVYKISKVGTVAGCYVLDGKVNRNTRVRVIRDGIVVYSGELGSLKRFKDDVKEVAAGYECGLNINNFNDIKVGDIIEGFEEVEVKQSLA